MRPFSGSCGNSRESEKKFLKKIDNKKGEEETRGSKHATQFRWSICNLRSIRPRSIGPIRFRKAGGRLKYIVARGLILSNLASTENNTNRGIRHRSCPFADLPSSNIKDIKFPELSRMFSIFDKKMD